MLKTVVISPTRATETNFATMMCEALTGIMRSVSMVPLSFSPVIVSTAGVNTPTSRLTIIINGMIVPRKNPSDCSPVAVSCPVMATGFSILCESSPFSSRLF